MKASLILSTQPYYVFLIIARTMGWPIPQHKEVEVRKDFPKASDWNRTVHIYCSKNMRSFNRIPAQYQPFMAKILGKVVGEFVCDRIYEYEPSFGYLNGSDIRELTCLSLREIIEYSKGKTIYGWHISDLKIYDTPKEISEFWVYNGELNKRYEEQEDYCCCDGTNEHGEPLSDCGNACYNIANCYRCWEEWSGWCHKLTRPFQSWGYVQCLNTDQ